MTDRMQILTYSGFHDFPRNLFVRAGDFIVRLDCKFDKDLDDYQNSFSASAVVGATVDDFYTGAYRQYCFYYRQHGQQLWLRRSGRISNRRRCRADTSWLQVL